MIRPQEPGNDVFAAIADANRRKLLDLLRDGEKPVQELVSHFDVSFQAVSQHLQVLRESGLVTKRAQGRQRLYRVEPAALQAVHEWTEQYREFWTDRLSTLKRHLDESK